MVNYALFSACMAATVLIAAGIPHPTNLSAEGRRVFFTLAGVGLAALVSLLLDRLQTRNAEATPTPD